MARAKEPCTIEIERHMVNPPRPTGFVVIDADGNFVCELDAAQVIGTVDAYGGELAALADKEE